MTFDNRAILQGWLHVPLGVLAEGELERLQRRLVYTSPYSEPGVDPLPLHDLGGRPGYLGVPREWGLHYFARRVSVIDQTSLGSSIHVPRLPDPHHPRVRDPAAQARFMRDLHNNLLERRSVVAKAPTGSGKTVCSLHASARLGRKTLILVHLERLMHQWVEEITGKLGVPESRVGWVQQNRCEFDDKDYVVGILHSVCRRRYPDEFYRAFGLVIYDELHKVGSYQFGPAAHQFHSAYRLGLSATLDRSDGGDRVYYYHLGPIRVTSEAEALPMEVQVVRYSTRLPIWGSTAGARVKCLTKDRARNTLIAQVVKRFYDTGRQALIVSDSVLHLQGLMAEAAGLGVPLSVMGQYTSETQAQVAGPDGKLRVVKTKQSKEALDRVKATSQLIFATYGMMTEGIDIPRLDAGIDATPRGSATQLIGRIRRPVEGKPKPLWVTLLDTACPMSRRWFEQRCRDYHATGAEVVGHGQEEGRAYRGTEGRSQGQVLGTGAQRSSSAEIRRGQVAPGGPGAAGPRGLPAGSPLQGASGAGRGLPGEHRGAPTPGRLPRRILPRRV